MGNPKISAALPELAAQWHPTKNGDLNPDEVTTGSGRKVWWVGSCGHDWEAHVNNRARGAGCPYCSPVGRKELLKGFNDLASQNSELAAQWSDRNATGPDEVTQRSHTRALWTCAKGHDWEATVKDRAFGYGCPYCAGQKVIPGETDLATLAPEVAAEWHPEKNEGITPSQVARSSGVKRWWRCSVDPTHQWKSTPGDRWHGYGCPYCSGNKVLSGYNDLQTTHPEIAAEWHPTKNGKTRVTDVSYGSVQMRWWRCPEGHEYKRLPNSRSHGRGCSFCQKPWSVAEKEVLGLVIELDPESDVQENYRAPVLGLFELDIYIPERRIGIEFNGDYWHDESRDPVIGDRHRRKQALCDQADVRLVVVWESDWNSRQQDVELELTSIIAGGEIPDWLTYLRRPGGPRD